MKKTSIREETENLISDLKSAEETRPDYMSDELKEIQTIVIMTHAHLETAMDSLISLKIYSSAGISIGEHSKEWMLVMGKILPILGSLSFRKKIEILSNINYETPEYLLKSLMSVNKYRIEFAHPKGNELRKKYDLNYPENKLKLRNLLRALSKAKNDINKILFKMIKK